MEPNGYPNHYATMVSVAFTDNDVRECMPHLKGSSACVALEAIQERFESMVYQAGCEIMAEVLREEGYGIGGKEFIYSEGGW